MKSKGGTLSEACSPAEASIEVTLDCGNLCPDLADACGCAKDTLNQPACGAKGQKRAHWFFSSSRVRVEEAEVLDSQCGQDAEETTLCHA